ncbi:MAG: gliding motility-associated C-terminal domain-containing protein, partial [Bacteroidales bacterium]|nr:gliding motility-associated C-terminal domain-containing protein [Bacteroidales bacterium]
NCGSSSTINITVLQSPNATAQSNAPICEGQSLQLNANSVSGASYSWSGPNGYSSSQQNPVINNTSINNAGMYTVTITDNNQCTAVSSINVVINPAPNVSLTSNNPVCSGSTLNINATQGYSSYSWSGPNGFQSSQSSISIPNVSVQQSGTYTVTVTSSNGCTKVESVVINVLNFNAGLLTINSVSPSCSYSNNGSIQIFVTGGNPPYTYHWSHNPSLNSNIANNLSGGYYAVTITDANNCNIDTLVNLQAPQAIQATSTINNPTCFGANNGSISLNISGGTPTYNVLWSNNMSGTQIQNIGPGIYSATITDNNQCTYTLNNIQVIEPAELILSLQATHNQCPGDNNASASVNVTGGIPPYTYQWNTGQTSSTINNINGGYHVVTITDANLCQKVDSILVLSPLNIVNNFTIDKDTINGVASINNNVTGGTPPYQYAWSNGQNTEDLINVEAGTYYLTITDAANCTFIDTFDIKLPIIIPSLFTPNGDGVNDKFSIKNIHIIPKVKIEIYNRWGHRLFTFNGTGLQYADLSNQWDAKHNGKELPMGSYVYIVVVNDTDVYNGVVSILR